MRRIAQGVVIVLAAASLTLAAGCSSSGSSAPAKGDPNGTVPVGGAPATNSSGAAAPSSAAHSNTAKATSAGAVDVCSLMTSAQASAINSVTYGAATPKHAAAGYDLCNYANTGKHTSPIDIQQLTVAVISIPNCYGTLKTAEGPGKPVSGIGDAAFGYSIGMVVQVKDSCVEVSGMTSAEFHDDYSHDVAMAKIIIGNLPH